MLSLYGKNNPPDHISSFCGPPLATHVLSTPISRALGTQPSSPLHVATMSVVCLTCLCSRELCKGVCTVVFLYFPKLPLGGESP